MISGEPHDEIGQAYKSECLAHTQQKGGSTEAGKYKINAENKASEYENDNQLETWSSSRYKQVVLAQGGCKKV